MTYVEQVPGSSAIQCYNPANGRFLGRVNPHTAEGIDRAIAKAEAAQKAWSTTSFSLRRIVLASMLRYARAQGSHVVEHAR